MGVLEESRIQLSLVPEELVAEAAREEGHPIDELARDGVVAEAVLAKAIRRWWDIVPLWTRLNFAMQTQQQTQWCWAAVSVSVSHYYDSLSDWTQCRLVDEVRGQTTCCENGSSSACNQPNVLDVPLERVRCLERMQNGTVGYATIRDEVDAGRPLAWRIGWSGGGGHFAVFEGYRRLGEEWVAVDDPWYGASDVALSTLTGGTYQGTGRWTHTYFTRRPAWRLIPDRVDIRKLVRWDVLREHDERMAAEATR